MQTTTLTKPAHALFDHLIAAYKLPSDAALCRAIGIPAPALSKMRARKLKVGPAVIVKILDKFEDVSFKTVRDLVKQAKEQ